MAPHLSHAEQDLLFAAYASGKTPAEVFSVLQKRRLREGAPMVNITVVRRFLHGKTHKRGRPGAHGRKRSLSRRNVLALRVCVAGGALHAHCTLIARSLHGTLHGTLHGGEALGETAKCHKTKRTLPPPPLFFDSAGICVSPRASHRAMYRAMYRAMSVQ